MSLIRGSTIIFAGTMAGSFANYLFQFFMGRFLSVEDYGALNAVFSLFVITAVPSTAVMLVLAKYTALFNAEGGMEKISGLYRASLSAMAALGFLFFLPFFFLRGPISGYLRIGDDVPVLVIGGGIFLSFMVTVNFGVLQGLQRFGCLGAGMGLGGVLKFLSGVVLVLAGLGLNGAVSSVALSALLVLGVTTLPLSHFAKGGALVPGRAREIISYGIPVLVSTVAVTVLTNMDIILVKHYFAPDEAGLYSAVSVLGKTVLYLPSAVVLALFPIVSGSRTESYSFRVLDMGLVATFALSIGAVAVFVLSPSALLGFLFGERFVPASPVLKFHGLAMGFMGIMNVLVSFNLARGKTTFIYTLLGACGALLVLLNVFHDSLMTVVVLMASVNLVLLAINLFMVRLDRKAVKRRDADAVGFYNCAG